MNELFSSLFVQFYIRDLYGNEEIFEKIVITVERKSRKEKFVEN